MAFLFLWLFVVDQSYASAESVQLYFSFPLPTTIMLFGISFFPIFFILIYMLTFDRWILTEQDIDTFRELVRNKTE